MTKTEMEKRIKKLGGLNPKTALIVSIEKWKGLLKHWDILLKTREVDCYPDAPNCALCVQTHMDCYKCPLRDCLEPNSPYEQVEGAIETQDKPAFMKARRNIIRRMQRALKKLEK